MRNLIHLIIWSCALGFSVLSAIIFNDVAAGSAAFGYSLFPVAGAYIIIYLVEKIKSGKKQKASAV